jgi:hypothetical protein
MRISGLEIISMLLVLLFVVAVVAPIGYAMEGLPSMFWAIGGAVAWVMIFALAAKTSSAKMHASALVGGWLCGSAWALSWVIARGLETLISDIGRMHEWGMWPTVLTSPFAGIGGGLLGGVAFGQKGRKYGTALGLAWGTLSGIAPFAAFKELPSFPYAVLCAAVGFIGAAVGVPFGLRLGRFFRPVVFVFDELRPYLSEMAVPFAGFVSGYVALVLLFTGLIGSLWRMDPAGAFTGFTTAPHFFDFVHFSVAAATGGPTSVQAVSLPAKAVISIEAILAQGWMIAVFAAVGAHLAPRFTSIAERTPEQAD